jgi:hypothetical protein
MAAPSKLSVIRKAAALARVGAMITDAILFLFFHFFK